MDCWNSIGNFVYCYPENQIIMAKKLEGKILWGLLIIRMLIFGVCAWLILTFVPLNNELELVLAFLLSLMISRVAGRFVRQFYENKKKDI